MTIAFVFNRAPLCPAIVRVKNCQIIDTPENSASLTWVRDVYSKSAKHAADREQDWLNQSGKMAIFYPKAIDVAPEQMSLFDDEDEE